MSVAVYSCLSAMFWMHRFEFPIGDRKGTAAPIHKIYFCTLALITRLVMVVLGQSQSKGSKRQPAFAQSETTSLPVFCDGSLKTRTCPRRWIDSVKINSLDLCAYVIFLGCNGKASSRALSAQ